MFNYDYHVEISSILFYNGIVIEDDFNSYVKIICRSLLSILNNKSYILN